MSRNHEINLQELGIARALAKGSRLETLIAARKFYLDQAAVSGYHIYTV